MSASREKKTRQESGIASIKAQREAEALKKQKRTSILYASIATAFVLIAAFVLVWNSNLIQKNATAAVIDGKNYKADELSYYYHYSLNEFTSSYGDYLSYLGLDTSGDLSQQESLYGGTWDEYFKGQAVENLKFTIAMCRAAEEAGYELTEDDEIEISNEISYMKFYASANKVDYSTYIKALYGKLVSTDLYERCLRECTLADSYANSIFNSYTYTQSEIDAYLAENLRDFQQVDYEYFTVSAALEEDADAPTEEALADALAIAKEIQSKVDAGESLKTVATDYEGKGSYSPLTSATYADTDLNNWLFDDSREEGDTYIDEGTTSHLVVVFHERYVNEYNTVDAHIIKMSPSTSELDTESDTYDDELAALMEETKAKAEEVLQTWKDGDATEESFAELANKHSNEGITDGEYTEIYKGYLTDVVNEWLFDESRAAGDVELLEADDAVYIVYYTGLNRPYVDIQVDNALRTSDYNEYYDAALAAIESSESSGMKYVN